MSLRVRTVLFSAARVLVLTVGILIVYVYLVQASGDAANGNSPASMMWEVITGLLALLQTIFMGVAVWLINNQSELYRRLGKIEGDEQTRKAICDERHK